MKQFLLGHISRKRAERKHHKNRLKKKRGSVLWGSMDSGEGIILLKKHEPILLQENRLRLYIAWMEGGKRGKSDSTLRPQKDKLPDARRRSEARELHFPARHDLYDTEDMMHTNGIATNGRGEMVGESAI